MIRVISFILFIFAISACSIMPSHRDMALNINRDIASPNQDARQQFLVMHYTAASLENSLKIFTGTKRQVGTHYLVPDSSITKDSWQLYQLVPEARRAWHAGESYWEGSRKLNASSIGIEIVNLGFPTDQGKWPLMQRDWHPYPPKQIEAIGLLAKKIIAKHKISPTRVIGHSDIAPGRKTDPGPAFPWERLYKEYGVGAWYDNDAVEHYRNNEMWNGDISDLQKKMATYGYDVPVSGILDKKTTNAIAAFQMHFYTTRYDGTPDVETVARLDALLEKYFSQERKKITN